LIKGASKDLLFARRFLREQMGLRRPALVLPGKDGKPYSARYDAVNAMLLNEFLKEHRKNEEQGSTIAELKEEIEILTATVREQASEIK
jgi:hypothetical protein